MLEHHTERHIRKRATSTGGNGENKDTRTHPENVFIIDHPLDTRERGEAIHQKRVEVAPRVRRLHDELVTARVGPDLVLLVHGTERRRWTRM